MTAQCFTCREYVHAYIRILCMGKCEGHGSKQRRRHRLCLSCYDKFKGFGIITEIDRTKFPLVISGKSLPIAWMASDCPTREFLVARRMMGK